MNFDSAVRVIDILSFLESSLKKKKNGKCTYGHNKWLNKTKRIITVLER